MKICGYLGPSGSRIYRFEQVAKYLNRDPEFEVVVSPTDIQDDQVMWADIIFVKELVDPHQIALLLAYKQERNKIIIVDRDDAFKVTKDNPFSKEHKDLNAAIWQRELVKIANHVIVTSEELKKEVIPFTKECSVIPNYLDMEMWNTPTTKNESDVLRIGWAGSVTHRKDLEIVMPPLIDILHEYHKVKFIYVGDPFPKQFLTKIPPNQHEFIMGTPDFYTWPFKAQTLALDIGLAPLVDNHFNQCRSTLKYLEYGMMEAAGIYSPTVFKEVITGKNGLIAKTPHEFYLSMKRLIEDEVLRKDIQKRAKYDVLKNYSIEKNIGVYKDLFKKIWTEHSKN